MCCLVSCKWCKKPAWVGCDHIEQALGHVLGATDFVNKDKVQALGTVIQGLDLPPSAVARDEQSAEGMRVPEQVVYDAVRRPSTAARDRLTPRQREVLRLIADGYSSKQIAQRLLISVKTVESHRTQIMDRLEIHSVAGLVRYAIRAGIIIVEEPL